MRSIHKKHYSIRRGKSSIIFPDRTFATVTIEPSTQAQLNCLLFRSAHLFKFNFGKISSNFA